MLLAEVKFVPVLIDSSQGVVAAFLFSLGLREGLFGYNSNDSWT
jgi:hypothetical protein